jgi:hypothetical protein
MITLAGGTASIPNSAASWMNAGVNQITITAVIKRLSGIAGYSVNPLTKYLGTTDCTFSWYMFGNNSGTTPTEDGIMRMYSNRGGSWGQVGGSYGLALNETAVLTIQYNSITGGQLWVNGNKIGTRSGTGIFGTAANTSGVTVFTPPMTSALIMYYSSIYDRELSDAEIVQNFGALRGRFGL